jgi:hypothetical protein
MGWVIVDSRNTRIPSTLLKYEIQPISGTLEIRAIFAQAVSKADSVPFFPLVRI